MTTSNPSLTNLLPESSSHPPNETHNAKERLYGEYLDQERINRSLNNEIKRKAVHKSLDIPIDDPVNINTTTHNYGKDSVTDTIKQLEQQVTRLASGPTKTKGLGLLGTLLGVGLGASGVGLPILAYQLALPLIDKLTQSQVAPSIPNISPPSGSHSSPQDEPHQSIAPVPPSDLQQEVTDLRNLIDELKNRKYTIRHFTKDGKEIYVAPLPESSK